MKKLLFFSFLLSLCLTSNNLAQNTIGDYLIIKQQDSHGEQSLTVTEDNGSNQQSKEIIDTTKLTVMTEKGLDLNYYGSPEDLISSAYQLTINRTDRILIKTVEERGNLKIRFMLKNIFPYEQHGTFQKSLLASRQGKTISFHEQSDYAFETKLSWLAIIGWLLLITTILLIFTKKLVTAVFAAVFAAAPAVALAVALAVATAFVVAFAAAFAAAVVVLVANDNKIKTSKILITMSIILTIIAWIIIFMQ